MKKQIDTPELLYKLFAICGIDSQRANELLLERYEAVNAWKMDADELHHAIEAIAWAVDTIFGNKTLRDAMKGETDENH